MKKQIKQVEEFHNKFKIENGTEPRLICTSEYYLRYKLLKEENDEYLDACVNDDLVEIADALGDQLYLVLGSILRHGLQHKIEEVFDEIQRSNMSKLDENGNPIFRGDGKIMKGEGYFKPDIKRILNK